MIKIGSHPLGIVQGSRQMFSDFANDGPMWTGSGARESRHHIRFETAFVGVPAVMVSISMWDADSGSNLRADISADYITELGFDLVFRTWGDTRIARIRADWTAIGALSDPEIWALD